MGLSLPPCCRGLLCRTISNSLDGKKARKSNSLKGKRPWAKPGIELVRMEVSFRGRREASLAPFGCTPEAWLGIPLLVGRQVPSRHMSPHPADWAISLRTFETLARELRLAPKSCSATNYWGWLTVPIHGYSPGPHPPFNSSDFFVDRLDAFFRVVLHAVDDATHGISFHQARVVRSKQCAQFVRRFALR
jgi:hypothetical protein